MMQNLLRAFVFLTPIAAVVVVLVRHVFEAVSTGAEINPWVLLAGSVLGWLGVQLSLLKFVDALGFEVWPAKQKTGDLDDLKTPQGDRPASH